MAKFSEQELEKIENLVAEVQKGDQDAFSELYEIYVDQLYRYVYYRAPQQDVEDILENVFLKIWEKIDKYKRQKNGFSSWAYTLAHNVIADFYRARKEETLELNPNLAVEESRTHSPIKHTREVLNKAYLKDAMNRLTENYREILTLKFINELSNKEISQILGKTEGSLRILQFRALKALKAELTDVGIEL